MTTEITDACEKRNIDLLYVLIDTIDFTDYDRVTISAILLIQSVLNSCIVLKKMGNTDTIWDTYMDTAIQSLKTLVKNHTITNKN